MATKDTVVSELVVNTLTQAQFDAAKEAGTLSPYELYGTPDASVRFPILTPMWFDHVVNEESWLRAETFSWHSDEKYKAVYKHLADDLEGATAETETIADITIAFYRATDGHKICLPDQESNVSALYETTGVAWYYILDTNNKQFKLPRTKWNFVGVRDTVGGYVPESLPDHNHSITTYAGLYPWAGNAGSTWQGTTAGATGNASESNSIYQDGAPVQQRATQMYLYFYVGNFEQDAVEQTAGINAEMFNDKLDIGLGNADATTKSTVVGWGVPDYSAGVVVASGIADFDERTYTAEADGVIAVYLVAFNGQDAYVKIDDITIERVVGYGNAAWIIITCLCPVKKDSVIKFKDGYPQADLVGSKGVTFYPFKGVN